MPHSNLSTQALQTWSTIALFWDETIGTGNKYWRVLQEPSLSRLLSSHLAKPNCRALDLATGNGLCARWLLKKGAKSVLATDGSFDMLDIAKARSEGVEGIEFELLDVTEEKDWDSLVQAERQEGKGGFDIVLMNMAIMDVAEIETLARRVREVMRVDGVFVATVLHPVFFTSNAAKSISIDFDPETGEQRVVRSKVVTEYLDVKPAKGVAVVGQPEKQIYFHRPLGELFSTFFKAGLVMDKMEELAFTEADRDDERVAASCNYTQLPAILAFRMRLCSA